MSTVPHGSFMSGLLNYPLNNEPKKTTDSFIIRASKIAVVASLTLGGISTYNANTDQYKSSPATLKDANDLYSTEKQEREEAYNNNLAIREIEEILQNKEEWKESGIIISEHSAFFAKKFIESSMLGYDLPSPDIDIHPDGQISFTWRKHKSGIMNIAFDANGLATWAAYFKKPERSLKGRFYTKDSMSDSERDIIKKIYNL